MFEQRKLTSCVTEWMKIAFSDKIEIYAVQKNGNVQ